MSKPRYSRAELAKKFRGALPRYHRSDDKGEDVVVKTDELEAAVRYLQGE